ncbi:hypothetical protein K438DRAFT_349675 [Mycena galopus ATCC 62051]|nr:hypothetical protein K438DRAFT_349675 [Mycena galopus ATCC 62051]
MYIAMAEVFLYGVYTVMFGFYVHVLSTQGMGKNRALPVATILLFILCTAHLGLLLASTVFYNHALTSKPTLKHGREPDPVLQATNAIYVTSNLVEYAHLQRISSVRRGRSARHFDAMQSGISAGELSSFRYYLLFSSLVS